MTTEAIASAATPYVLQPGEGESVKNLGVTFMATAAQTNGELMAGEVINGGPGGPPLHTHRANDELFYVVAGRYRFRIGAIEHEGGPGTFAYFPRGVSHTFACAGTSGRAFIVVTPAMDGFLREMADRAAAGAEQSQMVELFNEYNSSIDGPGIYA